MVKMASVPQNSKIRQHLTNANFFDAFQFALPPDQRSALELYLDIISKTPGWISFLMALRNRAAPMFGIKNLGAIGDICCCKKASDYRVGDRVGIFTIHSMSDDEVILMDSDKHLDAKVSIWRDTREKETSITVTTVVHVHNLLGHVYMFFVVPFHKRIVPSVLHRTELSVRAQA